MSRPDRQTRLVTWLRDHPLVWLTMLAVYAFVLATAWYIGTMVRDTPAAPFIYDL